MDEIEAKPAPTLEPAEPADLQEQFDHLRHLIVSILVLVILISGAFNIYLLRQWKWTHSDLLGARPQIAAFVGTYRQTDGPNIESFLKRVVEYSQTHPEFEPILAKYGVRLPPQTTTTGPLPALGTGQPPAKAASPPAATKPATTTPAPKAKK